MIGVHDRLALPAGVVARDARLVDEVREHPIPLNPTAHVVIEHASAAAAARALAPAAGDRD